MFPPGPDGLRGNRHPDRTDSGGNRHPDRTFPPHTPVVRSRHMASTPNITDIAIRSAKTLRAFGQRIPGAGEVLARSLDDAVHGRTVLITGASQGIGRATSLALVVAGAKVAVAARSADKLASLVAEIEAAGGEAFAVPMDVADAAQVKAGFQQALAKFGRLDILVNNAAITRDTLALRMKLDDWDAVLRTNLTGAHLCIQQALGAMLKQRSGRIINLSSVVAETGNAGQANYVASKAGLIGLTRSIAVEVASRNITVNAVAPGFIETPMTDVLSQELKDKMKAMIPLGRFGQDREIAAAIVFLASDEAGYITGQVLGVNGGLHAG